ncbi:hypothetical protein WMF37_10705 [Sorangium sp. So ce291]|uniref:hypothetical protein n=1 Tax=Sorangium sp. So ce291 TaxID=3133294 RepID=UPI003F6437B0
MLLTTSSSDGARFHVGGISMSAVPAIVKGMAVVVAATLLSSPLCFAGPGQDGAGLFVLPAPRASMSAALSGAPGGSGWFPPRAARALARTVKRVIRSGISPMFLGVHGIGVTVSGEM